MRNDIILFLERDNDYFVFLRENPMWYKRLNRNPQLLKDFLEEYKIKRRKRVIDKLEDIALKINLAKELA